MQKLQLVRRARIGACILAMASGAATAFAHWGLPQQMPLARVIKNLEDWTKDHPTDYAAFYSLARARSYAFVTSNPDIQAGGPETHPDVSFGIGQMRADVDLKKNRHTALGHLDAGIRAFNSAIKLKPAYAHYRYGLACLLEDGLGVRRESKAFPMLDVELVNKDTAQWLGDGAELTNEQISRMRDVIFPAKTAWGGSPGTAHAAEWVLFRAVNKNRDAAPAAVVDLLADAWVAEMHEQYFTSACMALPHESKAGQQGLLGLRDFLAWQSAQDYLRVSKSVTPNEDYPVRQATAKAVVKAFENLPECNAITPLVIGLDNSKLIGDLIDQNSRVRFDLDGTCRVQTYVWPRANAGFVVWDPDRTGKITSGRQLFGSATWWLFFNDGFAALASLDDNHDGMIRGDELVGLSIWADANSNGISEPGEVKPISQHAITSLSCRSTGQDGSSLVASAGVELSDGSHRPLWDWITTPLSLEHSKAQPK